VEGNEGRLLLITRGILRGSLVTVHLPLDLATRKRPNKEEAGEALGPGA
jgi:hypothetical protein